jgi:glycosyltransferase involved in cell wall biosynthesis
VKIWIVIPAFNEASVLGSVLSALKPLGYPIVVVDDASEDSTSEVAHQGGDVVLRHFINRGQGAALKTGIVFALQQGADAIVTFDSDGQHNVADIPKLLAPIIAGTHDVVLGSRFLRDGGQSIPPLRRIILRLGVTFTRLVSNINVTDTHNGLRAMTRSAAEKIRIRQDRMAHASEILDEIALHRLRFTEMPVTISYTYYSRGKGQSSLAMFKIVIRFLLQKIRQ